MRLIDADAFERDITEHILPILIQRYGEEEAIRGLHFSYSDCISNISGQPTIEEHKTGKWISASERLPDKDGEYLVTFKPICTRPIEVCTFLNGQWILYGYERVLAWQPMPEPWKGEE